MKKKLALIMLVLCLMIATPLKASPLYGGYNGQSTFWVDLFFFGIDDQIRWWVRVPVPLVPGVLNLNFKYESSGAISAEIAGHGIFAEEGFYAGIDTAGALWLELSDLGVSGGTDTNGNSWSEQKGRLPPPPRRLQHGRHARAARPEGPREGGRRRG